MILYAEKHTVSLFPVERTLLFSTPQPLYSSFQKRKTSHKAVNIFHNNKYHVTTLLSAHCKTYYFAFQKRLFCTVKA